MRVMDDGESYKERKERERREFKWKLWKWIAIVAGCVAVVMWLRDADRRAFPKQTFMPAPAAPPQKQAISYNPGNICPEAWTGDKDYSQSRKVRLDFPLKERCWSGWVTVPKFWQEWHIQLGEQGDWMAEWVAGTTPPRPVHRSRPVEDGLDFWGDYMMWSRLSMNGARDTFRLQGRGVATFYTNLPGDASGEAR